MKLLIDIPEETKKAFDCAESNDLKGCYYDHGGVIGNAIKNGIPLPEHHGRMIDAEVACPNHTECVMCPVAIECPICAAPTVIPATKEEKKCETCAHKDDDFDCHNFCVPYDFDHYIPTTKEEKSCETCKFDGMCSPNVRLLVKRIGCPKWTPKQTATKEGAE